MGVYYDFYLDKKIADDMWSSIILDDSDIFFSMRSRRYLYDEYSLGFPFRFRYLSQEFQEKNKERYENLNESDKIAYFNFYEMDLERMKIDFDNNVHEYAGIISKNSYKHLQSDCNYNAKIIEEEIYAKFTQDIKENYMYYEWDDSYSEYYYLYQIMPKIEKALQNNNLKYKDVRLLCRIC